MDSMHRCSLFVVEFANEAGQRQALCGCATSESYSRLLDEAFAHPLFQPLDESAKIEALANSLSRRLLDEAGVACGPPSFKVEHFFSPGADAPFDSIHMNLSIIGKASSRKVKIIEMALQEWLASLFKTGTLALPAPRTIPDGESADSAALRAGWRAEAAARSPEAEQALACAQKAPSPQPKARRKNSADSKKSSPAS